MWDECLGRPRTACECYRRAKGFRPLSRLAWRAKIKGELDKVLEYGNEAVQLAMLEEREPGSPVYAYRTYLAMGTAYCKKEKYDLAERCYQKALAIAEHQYEEWVRCLSICLGYAHQWSG